ncbi:hypothetical protein ABKA04_006884 [Annulohypoxylon sp. FPYF3050]
MLKHLAFIHIPPDTTVKELRQKRPFLLRAIIAVASPSTDQKMARGKELKQILAQDALTENQSSLDLLLGLLTYITWGWDTDVHMIGPLTPGFVDGRRKCEVDDPGQRRLEGQRAVMGCYLLSSIISSYYAQTDAMRWTSQMEEGLRAISSNKECPTDEGFALQIRLQLLAQRTLHLREQQESNYPNYTTAPPPCFFYLNALRGQLQELKASISPKLESQKNPAWDLKSVREVVDLLPVIDRTAEMLEQAGREHGGQAKDDIFLQVSRLVRMFRIRAATKIAPTLGGEESSWGYGNVAPGAGSNTTTSDRDDTMPLFDFVNDGFWEEFSTAFK